MEREELCPEASQVIIDLLRPIRVAQVITYLETNGWTLWANSFTWRDGWKLRPEIASPKSCLYIKPDPEATDQDNQHVVIEVPGREEFREYLSTLQYALERIAATEQTTFVTVICHILGVKQLVLRQIEE